MASRLLIAIHAEHGTPEFTKETLDIVWSSHDPLARRTGEIWIVTQNSHLPGGSLHARDLTHMNRSDVELHELETDSDWGWGAIQKLFFRKALQEEFEAIITIARGTPVDAALKAVLSLPDSAEQADVVSLITDPKAVASKTANPKKSTSRSCGVILARRYLKGFLKRIPFDFNDDGNAFDEDVMRQLAHLEATHESLNLVLNQPAPGFCRSGVFASRIEDIRFRLHSLGIWCSLKYRDLSSARYRDKSGKPYSSHALAIEEVLSANAKSVLDLGCGPGHVAKNLTDNGIFVHGVDQEPPLHGNVSKFTCCNLDQGHYPFDIWQYDAVLLLDLIEHLSAPEDFLAVIRHACGAGDDQGDHLRLTDAMSSTHSTHSTHSTDSKQNSLHNHTSQPHTSQPHTSQPHTSQPHTSQPHSSTRSAPGSSAFKRPLIVLTTPNVAFAAIRVGLLLGRFNYADRGILDITHRRLFTRASLICALQNSGYDIEAIRPVPAPFSAILPGVPGLLLNRAAAAAAWLIPSWFAFQWLVRCRPKPGLGQMRQAAVAQSSF